MAAKNTVRLLNGRFANWFYLIDEATYNKLHLANTDLIRAQKNELGGDLPGLPAVPGLPNVPGLPDTLPQGNLPDNANPEDQ